MRQLGLVIGLVLTTVLAAATGAAGQLPGQGDCALSLAGDQDTATGNFSAGETRTYTFEITNPSQTLDARGDFEIQRTPPPGWHWSPQTRTVEVPAGATEETTVQIRFLGDDGPTSDAELAVQVTNVECSTGGFSSPQQGSSSDVVSMTFTHTPVTAGGDGGLPWAWIVFGVIVAGAVVGVPAVYRSRGAKIEASVDEGEKDVIAGRGTSFPVTLKNTSKDPVPVKLEVADVQEGWSALTTLPDLEMGPRETRTVYMMVRAPPDAKAGDLCVAKLQVKPEGGSSTTVKTLARVDKTAEEAEDEPAEEEPSEPDDQAEDAADEDEA